MKNRGTPLEQTLIAAALAAKGAGNIHEALVYCDRVLAMNEQNEEALLLKAELQTQLLSSDPARDLFVKALEAWGSGKAEDALTYCDKALSEDPQNIAVLMLKIQIFLECSLYADAIPYLQRALKIKPQDGDLWGKLGVCYLELENWEKMLECHEKTVKLDPDFAQAWVGKGIALSRLGRVYEAADCYEKAYKLEHDLNYFREAMRLRELDPLDPLGKSDNPLKNIFRRLHKPLIRLLIVLQAALKVNRAQKKYTEGDIAEAINQLEQAVQQCKIIDQEKQVVGAYLGLGECYLQLGMYQKSIQASMKAYELGEEFDDLFFQEQGIGTAGLAYFEAGNLEAAENALTKAVEISERAGNSDHWQTWHHTLTLIYHQQGRVAQYEQLHQKAIDRTEGVVDWTSSMLLARSFMRDGRLEEAVQLASQTLDRVQQNGSPHEIMRALFAMGDVCHSTNSDVAALILAGRFQFHFHGSPESVWPLVQEHKRVFREESSILYPYYKQALQMARELEDTDYQEQLLLNLAYGGGLEEDFLTYVEEGLNLARSTGDQYLETKFLLVDIMHKIAKSIAMLDYNRSYAVEHKKSTMEG